MGPEILAPGGSPGSVYAAIRAGADAVYMGGQRFGARAFADNPDTKELLEIIDHVHLHNKKIYLTVNTILKDEEFKPLYSFLEECCKHGVDALIVQDLGVLRFIAKHFPQVPIHASTQMSIMKAEAANMLGNMGVTRIVPARELSLYELRKLRKDTNLELEVFVHGALCCSMSGQCLMSSMIGGRSGNRGACAQPCRKLYSYNGNEKDYHLSLKDLCVLPFLHELISCKIDSFKIEGRMKKPEYVALTTMMYKKYTDLYFELGYEGYREFAGNSPEFEKDMMMLKDIYNRGGFTCSYLMSGTRPGGRSIISDTARTQTLLSGKRPGHEGVLVGRIVADAFSGKKEIRIHFSQETNPHDVLEIRDSEGRKVHEHTLKEGVTQGGELAISAGYNEKAIRTGYHVFRIRNNALINEIQEKYPPTMPKKTISGTFLAKADKEMMLFSGDTIVKGMKPDVARSNPTTEDDVKKKIMVSGDSPFEWDELKVELDEGLFVPGGEMKRLRREFFENEYNNECGRFAWDNIKPFEYEREQEARILRDEPRKLIAECRNITQFEVINDHPDVSEIYLHTEDMTPEDARIALENANKPLYVYLPRLIMGFDEADYGRMAEYDTLKGFIACNLEELVWLKKYGDKEIRTADNLYVRNFYAYKVLKELGADYCSLSVEMDDEEIERFDSCKADVACYGRIPVMIMRNHFDESGTLKDEYGNTYTMIAHKKCGYTEILNYEPIEKKTNRFDIRLIFTDETPDQIRSVLKRYGRL